MKILNIEQRSEAWHQWRADKGMASEASALMGESKWEPKTPYQLFNRKKNLDKPKITDAMKHGTTMEPEAAACYVANFGPIEPLCIERSFEDITLGASLDGMVTEGENRYPLEIKCPKFSTLLKDLSKVKSQFINDDLPRNYYWQCQHILLVCNMPAMHFFVYQNNNFVLKTVVEDTENQEKLLECWVRFLRMLRDSEAPELSADDKRLRMDDDWLKAAQTYLVAAEQMDAAKESYDQCRKKLLELADGEQCYGGGVKITASKKPDTYQIPKSEKEKYKVKNEGFNYRVIKDG